MWHPDVQPLGQILEILVACSVARSRTEWEPGIGTRAGGVTIASWVHKARRDTSENTAFRAPREPNEWLRERHWPLGVSYRGNDKDLDVLMKKQRYTEEIERETLVVLLLPNNASLEERGSNVRETTLNAGVPYLGTTYSIRQELVVGGARKR